MRRILATAAAALAISSAMAGPAAADPYAAPPPLPALSHSALPARYAAVRQEIGEALEVARRVGDGERVRVLSAFLAPGRRFLSVDPRGSGEAVEVLGDLATARRIAIVVPGADGTLDNFDSWKFTGGGARALYEEARHLDPTSRLAVVAWLGYRPPSALSTDILTGDRAARASRQLHGLAQGLRHVNGAVQVALLCHSYGSMVCTKAAPGLPASDIAFYGSPGTGVDRASELGTHARIWAARAGGDWMGWVPHIELLGLGFGEDPTARTYGARVFDAGPGKHSAYLKPGSTSVRNLALIALGRDAEVTHV